MKAIVDSLFFYCRLKHATIFLYPLASSTPQSSSFPHKNSTTNKKRTAGNQNNASFFYLPNFFFFFFQLLNINLKFPVTINSFYSLLIFHSLRFNSNNNQPIDYFSSSLVSGYCLQLILLLFFFLVLFTLSFQLVLDPSRSFYPH